MKIVIIGGGMVGHSIVRSLSFEGHDIILIDKDKTVVDDIVNEYDIKAICGNGVLSEIQKQAECNRADIVICVTDSDEMNIISSIVAKTLGAKTTIVRVRNPEYSKQYEFMRNNMHIDLMLNPERETAKEISELLRFPYALHTTPFAGGKLSSITIEVPEDCNLVGLKISDIEVVFNVNVNIYAVQRNDEFIIPQNDFVIKEADNLYILGKPEALKVFSKKIGMVKTKVKNAMILGGSRIAFYLAEMLIENKINVKIIEKNKDVCEEISNILPGVTLVLANGSDYHVLEEEGVENIDAFITLTGNDEENIVVSLYAQNKGVENVITKVNSKDLLKIAEKVDLKRLVSTKNSTSIEIVKFARKLEVEQEESNTISSLSKIIEEKGEVLEFQITDNAYAPIQFKDLNFIKDTLIVCIIRNNDFIIPEASDILKLNDKVIVVTKNTQLNSLEDIFKKK